MTTKETGKSIIFKEKGSKFLGITYEADSVDEIAELSKKLRTDKKTSGGDHYMYAYRIDDNGVLREGKNDDGEKGGGMNILLVMQNLKALNRVTFVIRWYGGKHLGGKRFTNIKRASAESIRDR